MSRHAQSLSGRRPRGRPRSKPNQEDTMQKLVTFLWFDTDAEAAATFYVSLIPNSKLGAVQRYGEAGPGKAGSVMTVEFALNGAPFVALNGGPIYKFTEATSLQVPCDDQAEIDRLWAAITADGGEEGPCGWCKDRFGFSWQIVPARMPQLIGGSDPEMAKRAMQAMFQMKKLDIAALERAREG
jgi:predicted 3-demethylubiquinone-9 3-methyltransferase (glyoxalase superfamily)